MNTYDPKEPVGDNVIVYYFYKDSCLACPPFADFLETIKFVHSDVDIIKVPAVEPNLEFCYQLSVDHTPSVVVHIDGNYSNPTDMPVRVVDEIERALKCRKSAVDAETTTDSSE